MIPSLVRLALLLRMLRALKGHLHPKYPSLYGVGVFWGFVSACCSFSMIVSCRKEWFSTEASLQALKKIIRWPYTVERVGITSLFEI